MSDISAIKEQRDKLISEKDELVKENEENAEYVEMIGKKAHVHGKRLAIVIVLALVVAVCATAAVRFLISEAGPMWMWLTFGVPVVACVAYTLICTASYEKYSSIYSALNREVSHKESRIRQLEIEIDGLQDNIDETAE